jgi:Holliday junction resolvasome RuvABC endonuclease subunit
VIIGGVDLGARKVAISIFENGYLVDVEHFEVPKGSSRARELRTLAYWTFTHLIMCDAVWVEEPVIGRGVRASLQIAHTAGAVMSQLATVDGAEIYVVPNKEWKKTIVGNGNASKEDISSWLQRKYASYSSRCEANQDRVDATCIGLYGVAVHERAGRMDHL